MNKELDIRLERLAFNKTIPFCYSCYKDAPKGKCNVCHSDDLMRHLPGVGVEYGTDWIINKILEENLETPCFEELFEQSVDDCYGEEVQIGWLNLNPAQVIKNQDPISWDIAKSEYIDSLVEDEQLVTFDNGGSYYWVYEVEGFLDENESEMAS